MFAVFSSTTRSPWKICAASPDALTSERDLLRVRQGEILTESAAATAEFAAALRDKDALSQSCRLRRRTGRATRGARADGRGIAIAAAGAGGKGGGLGRIRGARRTGRKSARRGRKRVGRGRARPRSAAQRLTASLSERDALREERARMAAGLADLEERHKSALAELAEMLYRTMEEKLGLAAHLDDVSSDWEPPRISSERASAQDAAHSFALVTARSAHEAQVHALGGQLVDAEAALSHAAAKHARAGLSARVLPAS